MKCIGTNKDTYGLGCRAEQEKRKLGLGIDCGCYSSFLLNTPEGQERIKRISVKVTKTRKELEQGFKDKSQRGKIEALKKSVVDICHLYIRLRDEGKPCVSCGIPYKSDFDAGHFYSGGKFSNLKYNENNIHGQCIQCNRMNEGMHEHYRLYIVERIGHSNLDELDRQASQYLKTSFKWDRQELTKIRNYYKLKIKKLNKK